MVTRRLSDPARAGSQTHAQMLSFEDSAIRIATCFWRAVRRNEVGRKNWRSRFEPGLGSIRLQIRRCNGAGFTDSISTPWKSRFGKLGFAASIWETVPNAMPKVALTSVGVLNDILDSD